MFKTYMYLASVLIQAHAHPTVKTTTINASVVPGNILMQTLTLHLRADTGTHTQLALTELHKPVMTGLGTRTNEIGHKPITTGLGSS